MPLHPEFKKILKELQRLHGKEKGERLFYAWINKKGYNETKPLSTQDNIENSKSAADNAFNALMRKYKPIFKDIIDKAVDQIYDESIRQAAKELSVAPVQLIDMSKQSVAKQTLKENFKTINAELFDAISKELNLMTTDISLKGVPISNTKLKREIRAVMSNKLPRLESQAVTETTRIANTALQFGYRDSGLVTSKQWVAILDSKTTTICRQGNGEIVDIGEPFSTGDFTAPFHVNCRSRIQAITISRQNQ